MPLDISDYRAMQIVGGIGVAIYALIEHYRTPGTPVNVTNRCAFLTCFAANLIGNIGAAYYAGADLNKKIDPHRIRQLPHFPTAVLTHKEAVKNALARLKREYPIKYRNFFESRLALFDAAQFAFAEKMLQEGCCAGVANALIYHTVRGACASIKEAVDNLSLEDVFYYQLREHLLLDVMCSRFAQIKSTIKFRMEEAEKRNMKLSDPQSEVRISQGQNVAVSKPFYLFSAPSVYQINFEETAAPFGAQDVVGAVSLEAHMVTFQYGPRGYFFVDTFKTEQGLFQYPDSKTFFKLVSKHICSDINDIAQIRSAEGLPPMSSKATYGAYEICALNRASAC